MNYAREHWTMPDENPPVGLILCAEEDHAVATYALDGLPNKVLATECRTTLPKERLLVEGLEKTKRQLETRAKAKSRSTTRKKANAKRGTRGKTSGSWDRDEHRGLASLQQH